MTQDFDIAATSYDDDFTHSKIGMLQRNQVRSFLSSYLESNRKLSILEVNCGTGFDASYFASLGHHVIATDISEKMISEAISKYKSNHLNFSVKDIKNITKDSFKSIDCVFSNFGGLNCISKTDITLFIENVYSFLNPRGKVVLVIMPRNTIWEKFYFSIKGEPKKARRRRSKDFVLANVNGVDVKTWYYNPSEIAQIIDGKFKVTKLKPIGLWVPPSYMEQYFSNKSWLLTVLAKIDALFTSRIFSRYADHFYIELEKIDS